MRLKERTLKKAYISKTLREGTTLLLEADEKAIQQIDKALQALKQIAPAEAKIFQQAIATAKLELGKYLQGGIKQTFKNVFSDPVAKATTLANAVRNGMSQLPTIAQLYLPPGGENETEKSIWEMVPPENQKDLLATFTKSFKSDLSKGGLSGAMDLLKGNGLPYINNLSQAVQELLQNTNPQGGFRLGQQAAAQKEPAIQTATPEAENTQTVPGNTNANTQGSNPSNAQQTQSTQAAQPTQATQPAQQSKPADKTISTGAPKKLTVQDTDQMNDISDFLTNPKRKNSPKIAVDPKTVQQILAALAKNGMLFA